jgi:predicted AAA+ superfamily ATPase
MTDTPVVAINGARQVGKTTLVKEFLGSAFDFVTLDDLSQRNAAVSDPQAFVEDRANPLVIDEVQRVPELLLAIKASVDRDRRPGRYVLTGSTRLFSTPRLADSLAGRIELLELWPLSQGEIAGIKETFIDNVFEAPGLLSTTSPLKRADYFERLCCGGFPEVLARSGQRRTRWLENYSTTVVEKMVLDVANIDRAHELPRVLALCAARAGQEINVAAIGSDLAIPYRTLGSYIRHLQSVFLVQLIPAWSRNLSTKVIHKPKMAVVDTGLAAHLMGVDAKALAEPGSPSGALLENFVAMELRKIQSWSRTLTSLFHYRDRDGSEVDLILETRRGQVAGFEVKASSAASERDFRGLQKLATALGDRFVGGYLFYTGTQTIPFGPKLKALPVAALWAHGVA